MKAASRLVCSCSVLLAVLSPGLGAQPQTGGLVERARVALGPTSMGAVQLEGRGKAHSSGVDGALRVRCTNAGAFRFDFDGPLPDTAAFDGKVSWTADRMHLERTIELEEADTWKPFGWLVSGHWLEAPELHVSELAGATPMLKLALDGTPLEMTLTLDPASSLPVELVYEDDTGPIRWDFSDWRAVGGRKLPHHWTFDSGSSVDTYTLDSYAKVADDGAAFHFPAHAPQDVRFDASLDGEIEVERVMSGHLLVEPMVEGKSVGWFIFDTGAGSMVIDPKVADQLALPKLGEVLTVGIGGKASAAFRQGKRFELGPLALVNPTYVELDLSFLEGIFGRKIAGIVGYDLLARCVAEVETTTPYIALYDPAHYALEGGKWQDLIVCHNTPCTNARFEGERVGLFRLDTGANGTVAFHAPAVVALGLLDGRKVTSSQAGGVGGLAESKEGQLAWFELAGHRFEKPAVSFSQAKTGAFTDRYTTGNIAQQFLAPFRMVLDYPHDRIAFVGRGE